MALDFDGVNDKVDHGDIAAIDNAAALTCMAWVFYDTAVAGGDAFIGKGAIIPLYSSGDGTNMSSGESGVWEKTAATVLATGAWAHWASVYDGSLAAGDRLKIYKNGIVQTMSGTNPGATLGDAAAQAVTIATDTAIGTFVDGKMAHLRMWSVALTASEVFEEVWVEEPAKTQSLILWCPYESDAVDYSGNGNNGTITEATAVTGPPGVMQHDRHKTARRNQRGRTLRNSFRRLGPLSPRSIND